MGVPCPPLWQATRLLSAVIAKNAVGSSWRKTLGTREWSRVPEEEKRMVHEATLALMINGEPGQGRGYGSGGGPA